MVDGRQRRPRELAPERWQGLPCTHISRVCANRPNNNCHSEQSLSSAQRWRRYRQRSCPDWIGKAGWYRGFFKLTRPYVGRVFCWRLVMGKYTPLQTWLSSQNSSECTLSFSEIEQIIESRLPQSAKRYGLTWWDNGDATHSQSKAWGNAGWRVSRLDRKSQRVTFSRVQQVKK